MKRGIDVSVFQSCINWEKVRASGVDFAMIKATQGRSEQNPALRMFTDSFFIRNMIGAQKSGIRIGVYHYLTAQTVTDAIEEADYYLSVIAHYKSAVSLYAAVDVESKYLPAEKSMLTMIINAFCKRVQRAGFTPMVYTNPNFLKNRIGDISVWPLWLALWRDKKFVPSKEDYPNIRIWQYGSESVEGIGGKTDADYEIQEKEEEKKEEPVMDNEPNSWSKEAVEWAVKNKIMIGDENGNLKLRNSITREEMCVLLYRMREKMIDATINAKDAIKDTL